MSKKCYWPMMAAPMMWWGKAMWDWSRCESGSKGWMQESSCENTAPSKSCRTDRYSRAQEPRMQRDIVDLASESGFFSSLVEAVKTAGLVDTLKGEGPFTLLAPTDDAFKKIPAETLNAVMQDKEQLKKILTYHVVPGIFRSRNLGGIASLKTVEGGSLSVNTEVGVKIGSAYVIKADVPARNGVIHVIDSVLMPD